MTVVNVKIMNPLMDTPVSVAHEVCQQGIGGIGHWSDGNESSNFSRLEIGVVVGICSAVFSDP